MKSILQKDKNKCFVCHRYLLNNGEAHHVFYGRANRKISDEQGLIVNLCSECHRGTNGVHGKNGQKLNKWLKETAQMEFEEKVGTRADFMKLFGKNYL